jgi:hypothetical protein
MGTMPIYLSCFVCLAFLSFLFKFLNKVWWTAVRIQSMMRSQGIKGPSYKFIHGNSKEIINMRTSVVSFPLELSHVHELLPRVQPHIHAWIKLYGRLISSFLFFLPKAPTWWNLTLFFFLHTNHVQGWIFCSGKVLKPCLLWRNLIWLNKSLTIKTENSERETLHFTYEEAIGGWKCSKQGWKTVQAAKNIEPCFPCRVLESSAIFIFSFHNCFRSSYRLKQLI